MNNITYAVSVDVNNPIIPYNVYVASVLDSNVRCLEITLYQNGNVIALSNEATATASLVTDNVLVDGSVNCTISDNIITVPLEDLQRHGNLDVQVTVTEGEKVLAIPFPIQVRVTPNIAENAQIYENSLGSYAEVVHEIAEARGTYTTLHDAIENLEAIPYSVKLAMNTLFSKAAYADDDAASSYATFHAWAISNLVTFITAVFTQGSATIHGADSLDTLKQYLTVTAHHSDSTTETVTGYTLTGTLTEGTSTITVSYGGKTTTFNVTVSEAIVPNEYQRVEWISPSTYNTTGLGNSQYIETGIVPNLNTGIIARIAATSANPERNIFGIRQSDTAADNAMLIQVYSASTKFGFARWGTAIQTASYDNDFHDFELTASTAKVDDVSYELAAPISGQTITNVSFRLFGVYRNSSSTYAWQSGNPQKISYFKIMEGATTLREFIPCYRKSDGVIGMWDRVTRAFFVNGGTGTFIKGNDV